MVSYSWAYGDSSVKGGRGVDLPEILHMIFFFLLCPDFPHCFARIWEGSSPPLPPCLVRLWSYLPIATICIKIQKCHRHVTHVETTWKNPNDSNGHNHTDVYPLLPSNTLKVHTNRHPKAHGRRSRGGGGGRRGNYHHPFLGNDALLKIYFLKEVYFRWLSRRPKPLGSKFLPWKNYWNNL